MPASNSNSASNPFHSITSPGVVSLRNAGLVTEVVPLTAFYPAEGYHQQFYERNPEQMYCQFVISPKLASFRKKFAAKLKQHG